jgi:hypothetical protein
VGRYISLERLIEEHKERYYETLEHSSAGWHDGTNDPWPYANYILFILKTACREFEEQLGQISAPKGTKAEMVREAIGRQLGELRLMDIERACPGVGREWIRAVLADMKAAGHVSCRGRGPGSSWMRPTRCPPTSSAYTVNYKLSAPEAQLYRALHPG